MIQSATGLVRRKSHFESGCQLFKIRLYGIVLRGNVPRVITVVNVWSIEWIRASYARFKINNAFHYSSRSCYNECGILYYLYIYFFIRPNISFIFQLSVVPRIPAIPLEIDYYKRYKGPASGSITCCSLIVVSLRLVGIHEMSDDTPCYVQSVQKEHILPSRPKLRRKHSNLSNAELGRFNAVCAFL